MNGFTIATVISIIGLTAGGTYFANSQYATKLEVAGAIQEQNYRQYEDGIDEAQQELNLLLQKENKTSTDELRIRQLENRIRKYEKRQKGLN